MGYDGFKRISGTEIHVAVELAISIVTGCANEHDSTKFIDVMKNTSEYLDENTIEQIVSIYADKGYDAAYIRLHLRNRGIASVFHTR
ncbi:MAG: transposase [Candidatus Nitrosotenuis sp.]